MVNVQARPDQSRVHFDRLTSAEQRTAIRGLIDGGMTEYGAALAAGVSVEFVRFVMAERQKSWQ